ncbi:MAG: glycosyltransferase family 2 protein [Thermomicrobiales bacterium]
MVVKARRTAVIAPLAAGGIALVALGLYPLVLAAASLFAPRHQRAKTAPATRFALLIPAHDEERVIGQLLRSIAALDYPPALFATHVVADHCLDETAAIARDFGARVHERSDPAAPGKARSLNSLLDQLDAAGNDAVPYDAIVVLDADSTVAPDLLTVLAAAVQGGEAVIQARVDIANPDESWVSGLRAIAYCCVATLRPLGRSTLGLSAGLRGNGMCFAREVAAHYRWEPDALAEDHELHSRLVADGYRVAFAPTARVQTWMPASLVAARSQNERWERGRLDALRRYTPHLLHQGLQQRSWAPIDGALERLIPPFTIAGGGAVVLVALGALLGSLAVIVPAGLALLAQGLYILRGLTLLPARSPRFYLSLLWAPVFIVWKFPVYLGAALRRGSTPWLRTAR